MSVAGHTYTTQDVIRLLVRHALELAHAEKGCEPGELTPHMGCPVAFTRDQRCQILTPIADALGRRDLTLDSVIGESAAAATAYSRLVGGKQGLSLVVDFGGGSLDLALVNVDIVDGERIVETVAYGGDNVLGGDDVDTALCAWLQQGLADARGISVQTVRDAFARDHYAQLDLRRVARQAKEALSRGSGGSRQAPIRVRRIPAAIGGGTWETTLSAETLDRCARLVLACMLNALTRLVRAADLFGSELRAREGDWPAQVQELRVCGREHLSQIVLVGGSSQLRCVRELMAEIFGTEKVLRDGLLDPTQAVALGLGFVDELQLRDALRPPYTIELHTTDAMGQCTRQCLYRAFEPVYQWHQAFLPGQIECRREFVIARDCVESWLVILDPSDRFQAREPITPPQGRTVTVTINARTSLLRVTDGRPKPLFEAFLTEYGRRRDEERKRERKRAEEEELQSARQRALKEPKVRADW